MIASTHLCIRFRRLGRANETSQRSPALPAIPTIEAGPAAQLDYFFSSCHMCGRSVPANIPTGSSSSVIKHPLPKRKVAEHIHG